MGILSRDVLAAALCLVVTSSLAACSAEQQQQAQNTAQKGAEQAKELGGDALVTAGVKARLLEDATKRVNAINVDTSGGVVTLKGTVESQEARANAEAVAKSAQGVTSVVNELTVAPSEPPTKVLPPGGANANR
jgi:osmotically-inducible protein OsmY